MSKSVNVDFVTRQIEVDTDGKEHFISAAMAAKDAEQSAFSAQNAAKEVKEIYGDGNFTPLSDLLGGLGTKLKRWGTIFANKVFASNLPIVYNSVAEMKADTMLWEGMHIKTLGYYSPNDGGGALYVVRKKKTDTIYKTVWDYVAQDKHTPLTSYGIIDETSATKTSTSLGNIDDYFNGIVCISLDNGLVAELIFNGYVTTTQVGIIAGDIEDVVILTRNTNILQKLINGNYNINVYGKICINSPINIEWHYSYHCITSLGAYKSGAICMVLDNMPILNYKEILTTNVKIDNVSIGYKNYQKENDVNSYCIKLSNLARTYSFGNYDLVFSNMTISRGYVGIGTEDNAEPVWDTLFENINIDDCYHRAISLHNGGQLGLIFNNIRIRQYNYRSDGLTNDYDPAIKIMGAGLFNHLTIEDWYGRLFYSDDCKIEINDLHLERNHTINSHNNPFFFNGNMIINNTSCYNHECNLDWMAFIAVNAKSCLKVNNFIFTRGSNNLPQEDKCFFIKTGSSSLVDLLNITMPIINTDHVAEPFNNNIRINGKPYYEYYKKSSIPTAGSWKQGDVVLNSSLSKGAVYGWIAIGNIDGNSGDYAAKGTVDYSPNIAPTSREEFKVGDAIKFNGEVYVIRRIFSDTGLLNVDRTIMATVTNGVISRPSASEIFVPLSTLPT